MADDARPAAEGPEGMGSDAMIEWSRLNVIRSHRRNCTGCICRSHDNFPWMRASLVV
jgi:hypothetical protein